MYLRFQGLVPNLGTASKTGIIMLAIELRDRRDTPSYVAKEIHRNLLWFAMHLTAPDILKDWEHYRAICWFKPAAHEPLKRSWALKAILDEYGYPIDLLKTDNPGWIIYEDGWQVAAKPKRH